MNFLSIVKLIITLLPTLIDAIKAIEAALPKIRIVTGKQIGRAHV